MTEQPHRILVVDDDDDQIRQLLRDFLEEEGFVVGLARDAAKLRDQLRSGSYDLVVLDLMMPGEDGLVALGHMGADAPPVIMLSAYCTVDDRVAGLELGAEDFINSDSNFGSLAYPTTGRGLLYSSLDPATQGLVRALIDSYVNTTPSDVAATLLEAYESSTALSSTYRLCARFGRHR